MENKSNDLTICKCSFYLDARRQKSPKIDNGMLWGDIAFGKREYISCMYTQCTAPFRMRNTIWINIQVTCLVTRIMFVLVKNTYNYWGNGTVMWNRWFGKPPPPPQIEGTQNYCHTLTAVGKQIRLVIWLVDCVTRGFVTPPFSQKGLSCVTSTFLGKK